MNQSSRTTDTPLDTKRCRHTRCGKLALQLEIFDDHDSNAGTFYLNEFCSLECFVCELKHAADSGEGVQGLVDLIRS